MQILPKLISEDDAAGLLAELERVSPYSGDDWQTASFDFDTVDLCINIRLDERQFQSSHRNRVALVIRMLPQMHSYNTQLNQTFHLSRDGKLIS